MPLGNDPHFRSDDTAIIAMYMDYRKFYRVVSDGYGGAPAQTAKEDNRSDRSRSKSRQRDEPSHSREGDRGRPRGRGRGQYPRNEMITDQRRRNASDDNRDHRRDASTNSQYRHNHSRDASTSSYRGRGQAQSQRWNALYDNRDHRRVASTNSQYRLDHSRDASTSSYNTEEGDRLRVSAEVEEEETRETVG